MGRFAEVDGISVVSVNCMMAMRRDSRQRTARGDVQIRRRLACDAIEGEERGQLLLLPTSLDDYLEDDNPVRVVEVMWLTGRLTPDFKTIAD